MRLTKLNTIHRFRVFAVPGMALLFTLFGCGGSHDMPPTGENFGPLNDTGRTQCANLAEANLPCSLEEFPGQDAQYGRDAAAANGTLVKQGGGAAGFDFSKLGESGEPLAVQDASWSEDGLEQAGTMWSCVKDHTTGLVWEVKHSSPEHPRYGLNTYSWYNTSAQENGGLAGVMDAGECNHGRCDTEGYVEYLNNVALCGYSDWRMPTVEEIYSIGHQGRVDPAIDVEYFPNTLGLRHWTANSSAAVPQLAWYMYFSDASISYTDKSNKSYVRLVRSDN